MCLLASLLCAPLPVEREGGLGRSRLWQIVSATNLSVR